MGLNWEMKPLLENQTHPFTGTGCGEGGEYGGCRSQAKKFNWKSELTRLLINVLRPAEGIIHLLMSLHFYLHSQFDTK